MTNKIDYEKAIERIVCGALIDFAGYLTTMHKQVTFGSMQDASIMVEIQKRWAKTRNINLNNCDVENWETKLQALEGIKTELPEKKEMLEGENIECFTANDMNNCFNECHDLFMPIVLKKEAKIKGLERQIDDMLLTGCYPDVKKENTELKKRVEELSFEVDNLKYSKHTLEQQLADKEGR